MATTSLPDDGLRLAEAVAAACDRPPLILGVPRHGVPLAAAVARALGAPLDVVIAAKLHAPDGPEVAGIAEGRAMVVDDAALSALHLTIGDLDPLVESERRRLDAIIAGIRGAAAPTSMAGETVVLLDDAVVSGLTVRAAIAAALAQRAARVIVATPLCAAEARATLLAGGHAVIALEVAPAEEASLLHTRRPRPRPLSDGEIRGLLARFRRAHGAIAGAA
jgi:putative phosphoribosyl transferase